MGIDPDLAQIPIDNDNVEKKITTFFLEILKEAKANNLTPTAFKPNLGFFLKQDLPYKNDFPGSKSLINVFKYLKSEYPDIPVILDFKTGDIGNSSAQYASYAFHNFGEKHVDAVTVHPYMGSDSIEPYLKEGFCYCLTRTSNAGSKEIQNLIVDGSPLYIKIVHLVNNWISKYPNKLGMVVGATNPDEMRNILKLTKDLKRDIPLLIPGVGSQGGSLSETLDIISNSGVVKEIHRINASSSVLYAYKKSGNKKDFAKLACEEMASLCNEMQKNYL